MVVYSHNKDHIIIIMHTCVGVNELRVGLITPFLRQVSFPPITQVGGVGVIMSACACVYQRE